MTEIALIGNPNSGKTSLFNLITGNNQRVGNWPGVTVERKSGLVKKNKDLEIQDLPGIYSMSPYSPEEKVARERQKRIADGDDAQIGRTQRDDLLIRGEQADDALRKEQRREHEQQGSRLRADGHQAVGAAHARIVARAVKLGDEHGRAAGKAEKDDR